MTISPIIHWGIRSHLEKKEKNECVNKVIINKVIINKVIIKVNINKGVINRSQNDERNYQ